MSKKDFGVYLTNKRLNFMLTKKDMADMCNLTTTQLKALEDMKDSSNLSIKLYHKDVLDMCGVSYEDIVDKYKINIEYELTEEISLKLKQIRELLNITKTELTSTKIISYMNYYRVEHTKLNYIYRSFLDNLYEYYNNRDLDEDVRKGFLKLWNELEQLLKNQFQV